MEIDCGGWISVLFHKLRKRVNADMQRLGLTGIQTRVIHYILIKSAEEPVYQRDVESTFGVSRSTVTGMLQQMEKDGLIQRVSVASLRKRPFIWTRKWKNDCAAPSSALRRGYLRRSFPRSRKLPRRCLPTWTTERCA